ncbi:MAG TPA: nuclear transport factor 2 family protein [Gemmatimonadales bacterium]|nr:nuclear transport factor 2 family protein [Gemmatimonadales bacterium]
MIAFPAALLAQAHPVRPGPLATKALADTITGLDARLFDFVFARCNADSLAALVADDFEFYHDKFGKIASKGSEFVKNVREGCEAQAKGTNVRARRELVPESSKIYPMENLGALHEGVHRFYGLETGKPDVLRETGRFMNLWKRDNGTWKLSRVLSYDHHPGK